MTIDCNAFFGAWPFADFPRRSGSQLREHLSSAGIGRALVSPLGALFHPEPMAANRELMEAVAGTPTLHPVPVLNPTLATWPEHLEACAGAGAAGMVRIAPAYHNYRLTDPRLAPFMAALAERDSRLIVQVRLEDERMGYFGLKLRTMRSDDMTSFLRRFSRQHIVCCGAFRNELAAWSRGCANFSADFSFAESLHTLASLSAPRPTLSPWRKYEASVGIDYPNCKANSLDALLQSSSQIRASSRSLSRFPSL